MPGVKTVLADQLETLSLAGSGPRPIPAYWTVSLNNDPNFMQIPVGGVFPVDPLYYGGIIIPDPTLTSITSDPEFEDPDSPGTILKVPIIPGIDSLVDPSDNKILQLVFRKPFDEYVLNEIANRIAVYTAEDDLIYIAHFYPTFFGEGEIELSYRQDYQSEVTLQGLEAGDIDKQVLADGRISAMASDLAKLSGYRYDHAAGSQQQVNELSATELVTELDTLSGKVYILTGDHAIGTKTITDVDFYRHYLGNLDLIGDLASSIITITDNTKIDGDTFLVNGVPFIEGTDFIKGLTEETSAVALKDAISASADGNLSDITATVSGAVIILTADTPGTAGNAYTLAYTDSGTGISATVSGATFTGGTDYSVITLAGNIKGKIKVLNAADNSVLVTSSDSLLVIESDNDNCLNYTGTGIVILNGKLVSPVMIGNPTAPTPAIDDQSLQITNTQFVNDLISSLVMDGVAARGNTLNKLLVLVESIETWQSLMTDADADAIINTISEMVAAFNNIPEGAVLDDLINLRMLKSQNLDDVADKPTSRNNLDVYSKAEVQSIVDNLEATNILQMIQIGSIVGLHPYAPAPDSSYWKYCDGTGTLGAKFPGYEATAIPDLTDNRFLMGGTAYGVGGSNFLTDHTHASSSTGSAHTHTHDHATKASGNQSVSHSHTITVGSHYHQTVRNQTNGSVALSSSNYLLKQWSEVAQDNNYALQGAASVADIARTSSTTPTGSAGNQTASHTHSTNLSSQVSGNGSANHTHTIGAGNIATATSNLPQYFKVKYHIRIN